jgi:hypothetical protein
MTGLPGIKTESHKDVDLGDAGQRIPDRTVSRRDASSFHDFFVMMHYYL